jgi:hypothetical protein
MSRNLAAYFAIVGTLAFALPGAASAGQVNIPHININIPRPQISVPTPHPNIPTPHLSIPTSHLSISSPKLTTRNLMIRPKVTSPVGAPAPIDGAVRPIPGLGLPQQGNTASGTGSASAMPVSNTGGGSYGGGGSGGGGLHNAPLDVAGGGATGQPMPQQQSAAGTTSANPVSMTGGTPSYRCRSKGGASNCPG